MDDTNLVGFSFKNGWYAVADFLLEKMAELNNEKLSYDDCLVACGYDEYPVHDFSRGDKCPFFIKVFMTLSPDHPTYFIQMSTNTEMVTENFVCPDGISLLELIAKIAPIVQLKLTCSQPQALHLASTNIQQQ